MSTRASGQKTLRLMRLEEWARAKYPQEKWTSREFSTALQEYALITWELSEGRAENMAHIVQLRMTRKMPKSIEAPIAVEDTDLSVLEMIQGARVANPGEYKAPLTDFQVVDEGLDN